MCIQGIPEALALYLNWEMNLLGRLGIVCLECPYLGEKSYGEEALNVDEGVVSLE